VGARRPSRNSGAGDRQRPGAQFGRVIGGRFVRRRGGADPLQPASEHAVRRARFADELSSVGSPVPRANRDALLVLRDGRHRDPVPGLAPAAGVDHLRRAAARHRRSHQLVVGVRPRFRDRAPVALGCRAWRLHPRDERCRPRVVAHERSVSDPIERTRDEAGGDAVAAQRHAGLDGGRNPGRQQRRSGHELQ